MKCVKCGKEIPNNSKFCNSCGEKQPDVNLNYENKSKNENLQSNKILKAIIITVIVFVVAYFIGELFMGPNLDDYTAFDVLENAMEENNNSWKDTADKYDDESYEIEEYDVENQQTYENAIDDNYSFENNPAIEEYLENNYTELNDSQMTLDSGGVCEYETSVRGNSIVIRIDLLTEVDEESTKEGFVTVFSDYDDVVYDMKLECSEIESLIIESYTVNGDLLYYEEFE